jgi:hypothetical protein
MTPDTLERAVRAGWSRNNPIDNLGLFGMGFKLCNNVFITTMTSGFSQQAVEKLSCSRNVSESNRAQARFKTGIHPRDFFISLLVSDVVQLVPDISRTTSNCHLVFGAAEG